MSRQFNPPPNWPSPPAGWEAPEGWQPDPAWGPAPENWQVFSDDEPTKPTLRERAAARNEAAKEKSIATKAAKAEVKAATVASWKGIRILSTDEILVNNDRGPLYGATARVENSGDIERRYTATRIALLGPFALAAKKKKDDRSVYFTLEGAGVSAVLKLLPAEERAARRFASDINARALAVDRPLDADAPSSDPIERLRQLAKLRDSGMLTAAEFDAKKAEILGRI